MDEKNRSPLKDKPLRLPGQSLSEERDNLVEDAVGQPLMFALFIVLLAALEWWRFYWDVKPTPVLFSGAAILTVLYAAFRIWRVLPRLRNLRQGLEGERAVGQYLEGLRAKGFRVFHDLVGDGFNVDHVLIGPSGVFTVETKTWSKPRKGKAEITYDGERLQVGPLEPDRSPLVQAKAQAAWVKSLLSESTGRRFDVRPTIVFPGWFINHAPGAMTDIWVLEPKALPGFLENEPVRLSAEDVSLASFHLSRAVRTDRRRRA
jgi:hypothetical protein